MGQHSSKLDFSAKAVIGFLLLLSVSSLVFFGSLLVRYYLKKGSLFLPSGEFAFDEKAIIYFVVTPIIMLLWLLYSYYTRVRSIYVNNTSFIIERNRKPATYNLNEIATVAVLKNSELRFARSGDSAWKRPLVGYCGKYYKDSFGDMQWYCNKVNGHVLITMVNGLKVVVTPDDPERLADELLILQPRIQRI
jgi:hypothetical protein